MSIEIISDLVPKNSGGFPIGDVSHIRGAYQAVADSTALNAIPALRRAEGMLVRVLSSGTDYRLMGGSWMRDAVIASGAGTSSTFAITGSFSLTHNLGYYPNITVIGSDGNLLLGNISYTSINTINVSFSRPQAGTVYLS